MPSVPYSFLESCLQGAVVKMAKSKNLLNKEAKEASPGEALAGALTANYHPESHGGKGLCLG
jgi:hypothetical protein